MLPVALVLSAALSVSLEREIRVVMGTFAEIEVEGVADPAAAIGNAFERIEAVERSLSIWREDSEISRLNRAGRGSVSPMLFSTIERVLELSRDTAGAFDVTLEPHGYERIRVDAESLRADLGGTKLDFGAVMKGHAVDVALAALKESGATRVLVDLGTSSMGVFGDEPVTFEVRNPKGGRPPATFRLEEGAVSSSSRDQLGDHVQDPRTGETPAGVLAVIVVAKSAFDADALSTAVFVLGAAEGLVLLEKRGAAGIVLVEENGCLSISTTRGFDRAYSLETTEGLTPANRWGN